MHLVTAAFDRILDDLHAHLVGSGHEDLRPTHCLNVFRHLDCTGTRPTTLARRAGMTPQAMGELVTYLERQGYVRREPDPDDGRGRVVVYAERGTRAAGIADRYLADVEAGWDRALGPGGLEAARAALTTIIASERPGARRRET